MKILNREPAVIIGIIAACVLAVVNVLVGQGVVNEDLGQAIIRALDPTTGWFLPIILGVVTRFFVYSPNSVAEIVTQTNEDTAAATAQQITEGSPPAVQPADLPGGSNEGVTEGDTE